MPDMATTHLDTSSIPQALRELPQWVCWRLANRDGKPTKLPIDPKNGRLAKADDPNTWGDFHTALTAVKRYRCDGVGFVLSKSIGIVAVDFDHCFDGDGNLNPHVKEWVGRLNSYTEISPSGKGLHVFVLGHLDLPENSTGGRTKHPDLGAFEIYQDRRYLTVTGNRLPGTPPTVEARQEEIEALFLLLSHSVPHSTTNNGKLQAKAEDSRPLRLEFHHTSPDQLSDDELLNRARQAENGAKFVALFDHGDISGYPSASEADIALASLLLFWTGGDKARAERLFYQSALGRKLAERKKDPNRRPDYVCRTIEAAARGKSDFYQPTEAPTTQSTGGRKPFEWKGDKDYGHAEILANIFRNKLRWAPHRGKWMWWDGRVWREEECVTKKASDALQQHYKSLLVEAIDKDSIKELASKLAETCSHARIKAALEFLKEWEWVYTAPEEWDQNGWLFNCLNGTLDLRTGELRPHDPNDLITQLAPVEYDPNAECPRWLEHLELFIPNPNIRRQIQRDLGLSLIGESLEESLPIWYGTGGNGKSTTLNVLRQLLGSYAKVASPLLLVQSQQDRHPTELADLEGSRLVFTSEIGEGRRLDEERAKQLTGGENIKARYMRQDFFEIKRTWSLVMVTNHKPIVRGQDEGIWRRVRLIPWEVQLPREEQRPQAEVVGELLEEASGILNWLLAGLKDWKQDRAWVANEVLAATEGYRDEQDILAPFLEECCEFNPAYWVPANTLYASYVRWCEYNKEEPMRKVTFGRMLSVKGFRPEKSTHGVRVWRGLRLLPNKPEPPGYGSHWDDEEPSTWGHGTPLLKREPQPPTTWEEPEEKPEPAVHEEPTHEGGEASAEFDLESPPFNPKPQPFSPDMLPPPSPAAQPRPVSWIRDKGTQTPGEEGSG